MKLYNITKEIIKTSLTKTNDDFILELIKGFNNPTLKYLIPNSSTFVDSDLNLLSSILKLDNIKTNRAIFTPIKGKNKVIIDNKIIDLKFETNTSETTFKIEADNFEKLLKVDVNQNELYYTLFNLEDKNNGNNAPTIKLFYKKALNYCAENKIDIYKLELLIGINIRPLLILPPKNTKAYEYIKNQFRRYNEDFDIEYKFDNLDLLLDAPAFKTMKLSNGSIYIRLVDEIDLYKEGGDQDYIDAYFKFVEYILSINKK